MYLIIKRQKADHLKHKMHELKEMVECLVDCYRESVEEKDMEYYHEMARGRHMSRGDYDYEDDYRDMARGRSGGRSMARGRY